MARPTSDPDPPPPGRPHIRPDAGAEGDPLDSERFGPSPPRARAGRKNLREKLWAGLSGFKAAVRGDSSFFAHGYRVLLVAITAAMLGVGLQGWMVLIFAGMAVFIAELNHSAVDTLARAIGDPEEPRLKLAREIAAAGVLVAVVGFAALVGTVLVLRFGDLLGWWR